MVRGVDEARRLRPRVGVYQAQAWPASVLHHERRIAVRVLDISEGGLRVNSAERLPDGETAMRLESPRAVLELRLRKVWNEALLGGYWVGGFELIDPPAGVLQALTRLLPVAFEGAARRRSFRVPRLAAIEVGSASGRTWTAATTLDVSPEGMRIVVDHYAARGDQVPIRLTLADGEQAYLWSEVVWVRCPSARDFELGLRFVSVGAGTARLLRQFLENGDEP
ncbi:MAG: PilZ domain-containing protein [Armatimonadetes bacterium]|nr:PilZ domain-containing protein [Armatimonadota bacterium]